MIWLKTVFFHQTNVSSSETVVVAEQTHNATKLLCYFVIDNSFERGSTNQHQGPELYIL